MPLILLLLVAAFVAHFWWLLAASAPVAVAGWAVGKWLVRRDDHAQAQRRCHAEVCARADHSTPRCSQAIT
jgi:Flp pilus assembly protein TadB